MRTETLKSLYSRIKKAGLTKEQTEPKVCQEVFVAKVGSDLELSKRVCYKGGLILNSLSGGARGYTKDIDFDFVKYPLSDEGLVSFFERLSSLSPYENIRIRIESIADLRHRNYRGKRVWLRFEDGEDSFVLLVDIGVYLPLLRKNRLIEYELAFGGKTTMLVNPIERTVSEKLSVFAIYGTDNTRDKDLFDAYWLIERFDHDRSVVAKMLYEVLVRRGHFFKNFDLAKAEMVATLSDKGYRKTLLASRKNWMEKPLDEVLRTVIAYILGLKKE